VHRSITSGVVYYASQTVIKRRYLFIVDWI